MRRVVVTGVGAYSSFGLGADTMWENLMANNSVIKPIPKYWDKYSSFKSQFISTLPPIDYLKKGFKKYELRFCDQVSLNAVISAQEALEHANFKLSLSKPKINGLSIADIDPMRTGVYYGTGVGGVNGFIENILHHYCYRTIQEMRDIDMGDDAKNLLLNEISNLVHPSKTDHFSVPRFMPNAPAAAIGIKFGIHGSAMNYSLACASGTAAIGRGFLDVLNGVVDIAITGGSEYLNDHAGAMFRGFDAAGTLATSGDSGDSVNRPFDKDRSGFLFSVGGAASLVLEEYESAKARGAPIIAEVLSYGETFDAHSIMGIEESGQHIRRLMNDVTTRAGIDPKEVDYVNAHGTGTTMNDAIETEAIESVFGQNALVNSSKSLLGHTIGASGALEAIVSVFSIAKQTTHRCRNLENPIRDLNFVRQLDNHSIRTAYTQSLAFGGHNCGLLFAKI